MLALVASVSLLRVDEASGDDPVVLSCTSLDAAALLSGSAFACLMSSTVIAPLVEAAGFSASLRGTPDGDCSTLLHGLSEGTSDLSANASLAVILPLPSAPAAASVKLGNDVLLSRDLLGLSFWVLPSDELMLLLWSVSFAASSSAFSPEDAKPGIESRPQSLSSSLLRARYS